MATILRNLVQGTYFWKATLETGDMVYTAQTVFPVNMSRADVVKAIAEKSPDILIDESLLP